MSKTSETLYDLSEGIRRCTACPLYKNRLLAVPGEGSANAKIMLIGEAPGAEEDRQGLPFVGRSGKFLDTLLPFAGITKKDLFITGSVKCRPPRNRIPHKTELKTCHDLWLQRQIAIISPKIIIVLGKTALQTLLSREDLSTLHGKTITKDKYTYFITYHPAAGMRFPKIKNQMINDFKELGEGIKKDDKKRKKNKIKK